MTGRETFAMALQTVWRRPLRNGLAILGVTLGTASLVALLSLSRGLQAQLLALVQSTGLLTLVQILPRPGSLEQGRAFRASDVEAVRAVPGVREAFGVYAVPAALSLDGRAAATSARAGAWAADSLPAPTPAVARGGGANAPPGPARPTRQADGPGCVPGANSFSANTLVATEQGRRPIAAIRVGDRVLAWNEATGVTGFYPVTATLSHQDPTIVRLTQDGETLLTTPEHPFWVEGTGWVPAEALQAGMRVRRADGGFGVVHALAIDHQPRVMHNLTVETAHTFFVGEGQWLVHNAGECGPSAKGGSALARAGLAAEDSVSTAIGVSRNVGPGRITVPGSGRGGFRVPEFDPKSTIAFRGTIVEVKDVARLSSSRQLRDLQAYAWPWRPASRGRPRVPSLLQVQALLRDVLLDRGWREVADRLAGSHATPDVGG